MVARAREGYVSKTELTKAKADAVNEYKAFLIEKKLLKGHDAPPAEGGGGAASNGSLTADSYAAKLKAGEFIDPAAVDAMTRRFNAGG